MLVAALVGSVVDLLEAGIERVEVEAAIAASCLGY
jgi:hypothetical protein